MEWTTSFLPENQIVVIQTYGIADKASSLEIVKNISEIMLQYRARQLLIDHTAIRSVSGSTVEIYNRPKELRKIGVPSTVQIAEVVQPIHKQHFDFLETVCRNRGFEFLIFNDRESTIQWLSK